MSDSDRERDELLDQLVEIWRAELLLGAATPDVDFVEVDGSSLTAVRIMNRVRETLGEDIETALIFNHSTPRALAAEIVSSRN
ncbi:acyl carrier protein [Actinophytocola sp.]|uniref:acyl carrier protein n=1 Tax=Actinophytocola sp. TaxID=1872138 RepID=UPI003899EC59